MYVQQKKLGNVLCVLLLPTPQSECILQAKSRLLSLKDLSLSIDEQPEGEFPRTAITGFTVEDDPTLGSLHIYCSKPLSRHLFLQSFKLNVFGG